MVMHSSYSKDRAAFLYFPEGAEEEKENCTAPTRSLCNGYSIAVVKSSPYTYTNNVKTIPQPILSVLGYSIIDDFKKFGITIESSIDAEKSLRKLIRNNEGSVILGTDTLIQLSLKPEFNSKIKVLDQPYVYKSYYYPFSKKTKITSEERNLIWKALTAIGTDKKQFSAIVNNYLK